MESRESVFYKDYQPFLTQFVKILKQFNKITEKNTRTVYDLVEDDLHYGLDETAKKKLFDTMKRFIKILKVEQAPSDCCSFTALASDGYQSHVGLYRGPQKKHEIKINKSHSYVNQVFEDLTEDDNKGQEDQSLFKMMSSQSTSYHSMLTPTKAKESSISRDVAYSQNPSVSTKQDYYQEAVKSNDVCYTNDYLHVNQSRLLHQAPFSPYSIQNSRKISPVTIRSNYANQRILKGNPNLDTSFRSQSSLSTQPTPERKNQTELQQDIKKVLNALGDTELHSEKAINDYGYIPYSAFFLKLIEDPQEATNSKWIGYFQGSLSDKWSHYCLKTLKSFFRKHRFYGKANEFDL